MTRRASRSRFIGILGALAVASAVPRSARAADAFTMRMGVNTPAEGVQGVAATHFASEVRRRSNGQLTVEVYPNLQLANEQGTIEGLTTGTIDFAMQSSAFLVPLAPKYQVLDMPFLFKNAAAAYRVLDGAIGAELAADLQPRGVLVLGFSGNFKQLSSTTKAVNVPEDMKGMRVRIQSSAVFVATYQALGAIPVTIDSSEAFLALTQHTVDAIDFNLPTVVASKYYTVTKHVAMMNHFFSATPLLGSKRKIEALPAALQKVVADASKDVIPFWRGVVERQTKTDVTFLQNNGVAFTEIRYPAFRKAMDPVYTVFQAKIGGDLLARAGRASGG